jgi:hypothetical protein
MGENPMPFCFTNSAGCHTGLGVLSMPIIEEEVIGSQSDDDQPNEELNQKIDASMDEALKAFGIEDEEEKSVNDKTPAIEEVKTETKKTIVKFNKEDVEIDDENIPELLQKGLALDKERERKSELEKTLDRAARLAGYNDHTEYAANLDKLEQQQQQKQQTELDTLKNELLDELVEVGNLDRQKAEQYIENHPLFLEGKKAIEERQKAMQQSEQVSKWQPLYKAYPELEKAVMDAKGQPVDWFTPELATLVSRGNDPLLAYEHLNKDKIQQQTKKATEQRIIKEQQLGLRSRVETNTTPDSEPQVSAELASAFAAFGLPAESAKKYVKK